jgi:hypothetical protein
MPRPGAPGRLDRRLNPTVARMIRRIKTSTGNVRIDLDDDSHVAWLLRRHLRGEKQKQIGKQLGYSNGSVLCVRFEEFTRRYCPEAAVQTTCYSTCGDKYQMMRVSEPRRQWFETACRRFYGNEYAVPVNAGASDLPTEGKPT